MKRNKTIESSNEFSGNDPLEDWAAKTFCHTAQIWFQFSYQLFVTPSEFLSLKELLVGDIKLISNTCHKLRSKECQSLQQVVMSTQKPTDSIDDYHKRFNNMAGWLVATALAVLSYNVALKCNLKNA
uniref:Uncharacterized protein n=1 Tax=Glossina brevipalpis TaxID=37001 RepID=A0A1A9WIL1_9MUSC